MNLDFFITWEEHENLTENLEYYVVYKDVVESVVDQYSLSSEEESEARAHDHPMNVQQ